MDIAEKKNGKKDFLIRPEGGGKHRVNFLKDKINENEYDNYNQKDCEYEEKEGLIVKIIIEGKTFENEEAKKEVKKQPKQTRTNTNNQRTNNSNQMPDSFKIEKCKIPSDTKNINDIDIDNFNLKLNKFARFDIGSNNDKKFLFYKNDKNDKYSISADFSNVDFDKINNDLSSIKNFYESLGYEILSDMEFKPEWRLIVGLGGASVYETSITLHHIYGIPYIPASGIKGAFRNFIITEYFNSDEKKAMKDKGFEYIFGSQDKKGKVIFMDAMPKDNNINLNFDIMNPHYSDYYSGKEPPADYISPVPIPFIVVENTAFDFPIAVEKNPNLNLNNGDSNLFNESETSIKDFIKNKMKQSLTEYGLGAKTAVGYGYFD